MNEIKINKKGSEVILAMVIIAFIGAIISAIFISSSVEPWFANNTGKAQLAKATQNRQIAILEARAQKESAVLKAEAEVERAKGIAEANKIIANSITDEYLKYRFIEGLNDGNTEVIYVPTEANLPILEATRND